MSKGCPQIWGHFPELKKKQQQKTKTENSPKYKIVYSQTLVCFPNMLWKMTFKNIDFYEGSMSPTSVHEQEQNLHKSFLKPGNYQPLTWCIINFMKTSFDKCVCPG